MAFKIGDKVGEYSIVDTVGAGGAGQVFKVRHSITGRIEAMKVRLQGRPKTAMPPERFQREIKVQASLTHPNIASVHNAFWVEDELVLVMELVPGRSLDRLVADGGIPLGHALDYAAQCLAALEYAHGRGITHRDVKPENIMVTPDHVVKLMDFGLARDAGETKLTQTGAVVGSLFYISPEQARGLAGVDFRSDLYSAGAVLYEMIAGRTPFPYNNSYKLLRAAVQEKPQAPIEIQPTTPKDLSDAILRAMAKDPAKRFGSAAEFRDVIEEIAARPSVAQVSPRPVRPAEPRRTTVRTTRKPVINRRAKIVRLALVGMSFLLLMILGARQFADNALVEQVRDYQEAAEAPPSASPPPFQADYGSSRTLTFPGVATTLAFAPGGEFVAAASAGGSVELLSLRTGASVAMLQGRGEPPAALAFSPDGDTLAGGGRDGTVRLWSVRERAEAGRLTHADAVRSLAFSADGAWLAAGSADRSVRVWNLSKPGESRGLAGPAGGATSLAFNPSGSLLVGVGADGETRLWALGDDIAQETLESGPAGAFETRFSANGLELLSLGPRQAVLWDMPTRRRGATLDVDAPAATSAWTRQAVPLTAFVPKSRPEVVEIWDVRSGAKLGEAAADAAIQTLALSDDAALLAAALDGRIEVWRDGGAQRSRPGDGALR